jgi:hypothetical protein
VYARRAQVLLDIFFVAFDSCKAFPVRKDERRSAWPSSEAAALLNRQHDLQLAEAEVPPLVLSQGRPVGAEDISDLQRPRRSIPMSPPRHCAMS